jgi:predicted DNA-binding transcriptional regulator YafY
VVGLYNGRMPGERVQRLLRLITVLQRDESNTTGSLMRELGVSRRTLFRDLQTLEEAGVPHIHDRDRGYRIDQTFYLPPINLTVSETMGLMLLSKFVVAQRDRPMVNSAISAIYKLIATVPDSIREACTDLMANVSVDPNAHLLGEKEEMRHHAPLQRCIDQGRSCRIVYQGPTEPDGLHAVLNPYLLHYVNRAWYVLGYTDVHDEVRMLKLARLSELEPTDETFPHPIGYCVQDKLGLAWQLIPEGKEYKVVLEFTKKIASNVSEVRWHQTQEQEVLDDGRCRMTFTVDGIGEIAWWICGYADQVTVIKPPELRDRIEQMHRAAAERYAAKEVPGAVTLGMKPKVRIAKPDTL